MADIWVFLSLAIDNSVNTLYGYRRRIVLGSEYGKYDSRVPGSGNLFTISPSTKIYWGGDTLGRDCNCEIQYVRFYIDYAANSEAQMLNLALMNPQSTFSYFYRNLKIFMNKRQIILPAFPKWLYCEQQPNHSRRIFH